MLDDGKGQYVDDVKGGILDSDGVVRARAEEMRYVWKHKLYSKVPRQRCYDTTGKGPVKTGWVDTNTGCEEKPNLRSRFVAKEYKTHARAELFAATPPLEALRLFLSEEHQRVIATAAYWWSTSGERTSTRLLAERCSWRYRLRIPKPETKSAAHY